MQPAVYRPEGTGRPSNGQMKCSIGCEARPNFAGAMGVGQ
uniref:Uncharacterized protein n=1 Tax=Salmonella phage PMBT18 TaxID=3229742 RepID=A0AB39C192_9CAUD